MYVGLAFICLYIIALAWPFFHPDKNRADDANEISEEENLF